MKIIIPMALMSGLAGASEANYFYIKCVETLPDIFARELGALTHMAACKGGVEVTCPDGVQPLGFIGRSDLTGVHLPNGIFKMPGRNTPATSKLDETARLAEYCYEP